MSSAPEGAASTRSEALPATNASSDGWLLAACCLAAAAVLGQALKISNGAYHPAAIARIGWTLGLSGLAVVLPRFDRRQQLAEAVIVLGVVGMLGLQIHDICFSEPGEHLFPTHPWPYGPMYWGVALEALAAGAALAASQSLRRWLIPALLLAYLPLGYWMLKISPEPGMDVYVFQRDAAKALLSGDNPYAMTFPNVYGGDVFYGAGMVVDGRVQFGFPYLPFSLLLSVPGFLFGDVRYSQLAALALAGALMAFARGGRVIAAAALGLFLLTPRLLVVLQMGWTEPLLIFMLALTVFVACRHPRALPYVLGLLLASKQYTVFMIPLIPLLTPLRGRALFDFLWRTAAVTLVVSLPLALRNPSAFWWSVAKLQFHQPFRMDALSYLVWWIQRGHPQPPVWIAFVATGVSIVIALFRAPRSPAGFAAAVAFVYCTFFAFNKQAFLNYYFFVLGALCIAAAAALTSPRQDIVRSPERRAS